MAKKNGQKKYITSAINNPSFRRLTCNKLLAFLASVNQEVMLDMECSDHQLNTLKLLCEKLLRSSQVKSRYNLEDFDNLGFMSLCFLSKQIDHMSAILKLTPHHDIQLISRTMIEGLIQLLWCFKEPDRAFMWRGFAWINDWRISREMTNKGQNVASDQIDEIDNFIIEHGNLFKIKKFKNQPMPENEDPFHKNWRLGVTLKEISEEVGGEDLYDKLYSPYSDWQHWGVASIGQMIKWDDSGVTYGESANFEELCSSLAVAFQCLYQVIELNNSHHGLDMESKLEELRNEYISMHQA